MDEKIIDIHQNDPIWNKAMQFVLDLDRSPEDSELTTALYEWLDENPEHRTAYQQAELIWALTGTPELQENLLDGGNTASTPKVPLIQEEKRNRKRSWPIQAFSATSIAACLVFIAVQPAYTFHDFETGTGEHKQITLSDSSITTLSAKTAINTKFNATERRISMTSGEAFFQVSKDSSRPFTVETDWGNVTVLGTRFNIRAGLKESMVVTVEEGVVEVGNIPGYKPKKLYKGDQLTLSREGLVHYEKIEIDEVAAWRNQEFVIENWTINEFIEEIDRYHPGFTIHIKGSGGNQKISGVFHLDDPTAALKTAVAPFGGNVYNLGPATIVNL